MTASALIAVMFLLAQTILVPCLSSRKWWRGAPWFMSLMTCVSAQSIVCSFGRPHAATSTWWHRVWAPSEVVVVLLSVAASVEVLWCRTSFTDKLERFTCRMWFPIVSFGAVMWLRSTGEYETWFGLFIYVREWVWIGLAIMNMMLAGFLAIPTFDPVKEPRTLKVHSYIFLVMILAHATIAPLARIGFNTQICQSAFMAVVIACCTAWITLCSPASARSSAQGPGIDPASPPEKPYRV